MADTANAAPAAEQLGTVLSAMRMVSGDLRVAVLAADHTFSIEDWHVIDATKLPPVELPAGRMMQAFVAAGGTIGVSTESAPALPGYVAPVIQPVTTSDSITRLQGRLALSRAGLLDKAEAAIAAAGGETAIWYADAQTWRRDDPHIAAISQVLGLTSDEVDALYATAAAIV